MSQSKKNRVSATEIDLVVNVKETATGSITGGIGYGSSDGFLISAGVSESNSIWNRPKRDS